MSINAYEYITAQNLHREYLNAFPLVDRYSATYLYSRAYAEWLENRYGDLQKKFLDALAGLIERE